MPKTPNQITSRDSLTYWVRGRLISGPRPFDENNLRMIVDSIILLEGSPPWGSPLWGGFLANLPDDLFELIHEEN